VTDAVGRVALPAAAPRFDSKWVLIGVPVALVVWLALVPLVFLLWQSFLTPQSAAAPAQYTLENFRTAYLNGDNARLFFNSLQFAVGAATHTSHGLGTGLLLPYVMEFNRASCTARLAQVARAMGDTSLSREEVLAGNAIDRVRKLNATLGIPAHLREVGVREEDLGQIAAKAFQDASHQTNPRKCSEEDLLSIAHAAY